MNIRNLIFLANKEANNKKRKFRIFEVSLTISIIFLLFIAIFNKSVIEYIRDIIDSNPEYSLITVEMDNRTESLENYLQTVAGVTGICEETTIENVSGVMIDDQQYTLTNVKAVNQKYDSFYAAEGDMKEAIIAGRDLEEEDDNKALIDEYSVITLGYKNYEDILGKKVEIVIENQTINLELVGVFSLNVSKNSEMYGDIYIDDEGRIDLGQEPFIISKDSINGLDTVDESYTIVSVDGADRVSQVADAIDAYGNYIVYTQGDMIDKIVQGINNIVIIMYSASFILILIAIINVSGVLYTVINNNKTWYSMLNILGYKRNTIRWMNYIEMAIFVLKSFVIATIIVSLSVLIINNLIYSNLGVLNILKFPGKVFLLLLAGVLIIICSITALTLNKVMRNAKQV